MKTITITQDGSEYIIHLSRFAADAKHIQQTREFGSTWSHTWLRAGLIAFQDNGDVSLTPRGEDLLASLPHLPDDTEPAQAAKPCSKCHGSGEQPLFVSMETCDRCKGSKVEPRASGVDISALIDGFTGVLKPDTLPRIGYSAFTYPTANGGEVLERLPREQAGYSASYYAQSDVTSEIVRTCAVGGHPWVLIDSEKVAQQFVGKRVQIETLGVFDIHPLHGSIGECVQVLGGFMVLHCAGEDYYWRLIGNVRLRLVDGDPS